MLNQLINRPERDQSGEGITPPKRTWSTCPSHASCARDIAPLDATKRPSPAPRRAGSSRFLGSSALGLTERKYSHASCCSAAGVGVRGGQGKGMEEGGEEGGACLGGLVCGSLGKSSTFSVRNSYSLTGAPIDRSLLC